MSTLAFNAIPLPINDQLVQGKNRRRYPRYEDVDPNENDITDEWQNHLTLLTQQIFTSPLRVNAAALTNQSASIGATDLSGGAIAAGLYEVKVYARITTPATTGAATSSLTVTIGWTDGGVVQSESYAAVAGNTTTSILTGPQKTIRADNASPITYSTTYASNTAGEMKYSLDVVLLRVAA